MLGAAGVPPRRIIHMAMDGLRSRDPGLLVDAGDGLMPSDGHRYWFMDEITGITDGWPEPVKWLRNNDARFRTDTVVLTGSSAAGRTQATKALAGRRAIERAAPGTLVGHGQVLHHRTASRKEIDFVGPQFGGIAFKSKYVDVGWRRDALTLKASRWQGVVATRSELDLSDPEVAAVPAALLAWLLDSQPRAGAKRAA